MSNPYENMGFQRIDASSNAHAGRDFESVVKELFFKDDLTLSDNISIELGFGDLQKTHRFDLGLDDQSVLVECKSHRWTLTDNIPSAKLTLWNEAMLYFSLAPGNSRKIFCVLKDWSERRRLTLAEYYLRTYRHLMPIDVEMWEVCPESSSMAQLK